MDKKTALKYFNEALNNKWINGVLKDIENKVVQDYYDKYWMNSPCGFCFVSENIDYGQKEEVSCICSACFLGVNYIDNIVMCNNDAFIESLALLSIKYANVNNFEEAESYCLQCIEAMESAIKNLEESPDYETFFKKYIER